jgi:hypothetical protein
MSACQHEWGHAQLQGLAIYHCLKCETSVLNDGSGYFAIEAD